MKTFFSKILLAQVITVLVALLVVTLITRASLDRGFKNFLETQEASVLKTLVPVLADFYDRQDSWGFFRKNPQYWENVWRVSRSRQGEPPPRFAGPETRNPARAEALPPRRPALDLALRRMLPPERGMLRERLFLLDGDRQHVAGAEPISLEGLDLEPVTLEERVVGWIGFVPMGKALPPEARRFVAGQFKISMIALTLALLVAAALAYFLAGNVSRPVRRLAETIKQLSTGRYQARVALNGGDELGQLAENVNHLANTLDRNRTARQRWIADIAHELRTPVAILKGEIEAVRDGVREGDDRMTASLQEEVDHLSALIDDLQALALSDAGALNMRKELLNLSDLVRQAHESFLPRLRARDIVLKTFAPNEVNAMVDGQRLRQLLHNLLENSCRYVDSGGRVRLTLTQAGRSIELRLEDSWPGVSEQQLERLFERFYRAEESRARATGGTGLGLSICRNIVQAHGGTIVAGHSRLGGLEIRITLPG